MTFPDQSHINRVRDALHQRSGHGASVMVGSGFSRNAERITLGAKPMPTWQDLADHFNNALYPTDDENRHFDDPRPAVDNLRIAQEYMAAFGRSALNDALQRLVPNNDYTPGSEHQRLLQLPWRDIYTTNWDTLLERSRGLVPERHYSVVASVEEIPMAGRPRIVKLHGSLPAQFPLIVTEEHYRTYPTKFAPFVNTVQQSIMETVFLLIGFSGDDPNFLKWSGWVRDNLGQSAHKIYLAGWLNLSPHRRRMLEREEVVPIDLAHHPKANQWPENLRHRYATDWLLHTLEAGLPYNITNWPRPSPHHQNEVTSILQPVEIPHLHEPSAETEHQVSEPKSSPDDVRRITDIWRKNRLIYPGWLTIPFPNRSETERNNIVWSRTILASLPDLKPTERLMALRELLWRADMWLVPIYQDSGATIQETLDSIDCHNRTIDGEAAPKEDWTAIREDWRNTATALVTAARFQFDGLAFEQAIKALEPFQDEDPDICHRIHHEKCLKSLYDMDFNSLDSLLYEWKTENCDPAWMMRKSALLWENRCDSEATELLDHAIIAIKAMPPDESSLANLSRESWATFIASNWENRLTSFDRISELVPMRCDVFGERQCITEGMGKNRVEEDPPLFDSNRWRNVSERWTNHDPYAVAYRAVRLSELAGLPPVAYRSGRLNSSTVWAEVLKKAAEEIADCDLEFAVRLVLRACNGESDKTLGRILTRTRVATIPPELAKNLTQCCLNTIDKTIRDKVTPVSATQQRFATAAEVLSRLVIRLEPNQTESILNQALEYCQNTDLAGSFVDRELNNLLIRSWEALPDKHRQCRVMDLLSTDIAGLTNNKPVMEDLWPDPANVVGYTKTKLLRNSKTELKWQSTIDLIIRGLSGSEMARRRASYRMIQLAHSGWLREDEKEKIAIALWSDQHTPPEGLPANTNIHDWAFLCLPESSKGLAEQRFRMKWLSHSEEEPSHNQQETNVIEISVDFTNNRNQDTNDVESRLWQVGNAIGSLQRQEKNLIMSDTDKDQLTRLVELWVGAPVPEKSLFGWSAIFDEEAKQRTMDIAEALLPILGELTVSQCIADKIHAKTLKLTANNLPAFALAVGVVKINPSRTPEVATALRVGLTSDDDRLAKNAASGLRRWLEATSDTESEIPQPPDDLVREIGIAIASRRNTLVDEALSLAAWIFSYGRASHKESIQQLVEDGLRYLAPELRYSREHENPDVIPLRRQRCAELAAAMSKCGMNENSVVRSWLEEAREDPLPEVRQAVT